MPMKPNMPNVTTITPPAVEVLTKVVQVARTDTTAFDAFALPKYAVPIGAYVVGQTSSDAATTAVINVGTNPGTSNEIIASFDVKGTGKGYFPVGAAAGSQHTVQLTNDVKYKAQYVETGTASTTGGPWLVKVEYYIPPQGFAY